MKITVTVSVDVFRGPEAKPANLRYNFTTDHGDNPGYWADSIQRSITEAQKAIIKDLEPQVKYRQEVQERRG